jgi:predicted Zn-dependent peptidase
VFREIETLRAKGPTAQEIVEAREGLLRQHESDLAQNNHLVAELTERYELGEDVAEFFNLPFQYHRLSAGPIQEAASRYLDPTNYVRVTLYPEATKGGAPQASPRAY